jgi:dimethylglycine dehydrogenase
MKTHARVVIIGGGMMGVGLLYHLAEMGWGEESVLVEKGELTSGSTWHAAGQCPSFIADYNMGMVHHTSNTLYPKLEAMTGQATGWHQSGGIRFALNQAELDYFKLVQGTAANIGYRMEIIGPDEIKKLNPFVTTDGVLAGAWTLDDGHVDPASCCNAMAIAARNMGASIYKNNRVLGVTILKNGEFEVKTEKGTIVCEHLVNAAGCYAKRVSAWLGVDTQFTNMLHQYIVTEEIPEFAERDVELPVMRDPYPSSYYRQEQNAGLIGIYEAAPTIEAWPNEGQAWDSQNELFAPDLERIFPWIDRVMERMPIFESVGVQKVINGAISHTIDSNPLVGPAPGVKNFWLCTGASIGIAQGAGCGKYLAQWMIEGAAEINMMGMDPRRFGDYATKEYTDARAHREYWDMYVLLLPGETLEEGRNARVSPLNAKLREKGAVFADVFGWERPQWFPPNGETEAYGFKRNNVFEHVGREAKAVREKVGILELPSFSKWDVSGPDAHSFLDRMTTNKMPKEGRINLTHALNDIGRYETEFTITHLPGGRYYLLSGATGQLRDTDLLNFNKRDDEDVTITDVTIGYSVLVLAGPHSRDVLQQCTDQDLSNKAFRWLRGKEIQVAGVDVRALRVNYVGELGWELHVPMADAVTVYDALWAAGEQFGVVDFGTYAMNSMRMEKAYAGFGVEMTNEITPYEGGTMRFTDMDKDFSGKDAVLKAMDSNPKLTICYVEVDVPMGDDNAADVAGGEPCFDGDSVIGLTTSGGYGHCTGKSLAFAYVSPEFAKPGCSFEIEILGDKRQATVLDGPVYDASASRSRA